MSARPRFEDHLATTRRDGAQAGHPLVQPGRDCPQRVVVEGRHGSWVDGPVGQHAVPALPDGGGALLDRVEPRGTLALHHQRVGLLVVPRQGQRFAHERRAGEAARDPCPRVLDEHGQPVAGRGLASAVEEVEADRQGVRGLGVAGKAILLRPPGAHEGGSDVLGQVRVLLCLFCLSQEREGARQRARRAREVRGGHQVRVGHRGGGVVGRSTRVQPVAQLIAAVPHVSGAGHPIHEIDPGASAGHLVPKDLRVPGGPVEVPRRQHRYVTPDRARPRRRPHVDRVDVGDVPRHVAVGLLLDGDVAQPRAQHADAVVEEQGCRGERLQVAGPPQAFVALRAVGGDVDEVAAHAPHHVLVEALQLRVGAGEPTRALHVGVQDDGLHLDIGSRQVAPGVDLGVAEAVVGETGLPRLGVLATGQGVPVGRLGVAQRTGAELAVLDDLGVPELHGVAATPVRRDPQPADQVLAEVQDPGPGGRAPLVHGAQDLGRPHRRPLGRDQGREVQVHGLHRRPGRQVGVGQRP